MKDALIMRKYLLSQSAQICIKMFAKTQSLQLFQKVLPVSVNKILQVKSFTQQASAVKCVNLRERTLLHVTGPDAKDLLQGLTTNDMQILTENNRALYTMFLNNQGRILYDVICYRIDPGRCEQVCYFLECDTAASQSLVKHLKMYKLRKKVDIALYDEAEPWAIYDGMMGDVSSDLRVKKSIVVQDPRIPEFGSRVLMHHSETSSSQFSIIMSQKPKRTASKQPVGEDDDFESFVKQSLEKLINGQKAVEHKLSESIEWNAKRIADLERSGKAKDKKLKLLEAELDSPTTAIEPGASVKNEDGKNAGKFRGHIGENGLALVRVALSQNKKLFVKDQDDKSIEMQARIPDWWPMSFSKGCYLGQELTARTHYTGVIRKRIMPVDIISSPTTAIEPGASVKNEDGKNAGKFRGHIRENGLALVRVALSQNKKLFVKDQDDKSIEMQARIPDWWPSKEELVIQ
ncbi:putative transferase CAF17 homolog, mitochondrial [Anneissia japonica]|uniref:putative transferase CAF17 homolog, mitochondrial n=1 Tax=Anneissia japonica TaxID=1529436 RepID=UPI00142577A4|nr:putative transferase CAF17 homolog, mitochondrial [Anneissia japonica]